MTRERIANAKREAKRFLQRVDEYVFSGHNCMIGGHMITEFGVKESGALRRASMDLTRALADMRRSR